MSMNINGVGSSTNVTSTSAPAANKATSNAATTETKKNENNATVYEKSEKTNYKPDTETLEKIKAEVLAQTASLRDLVTKLLTKQGLTWKEAMSDPDLLVEIDEETRTKAQELISEDGYYGVKQTTERLIGFAKAISGGDPSKIELLRDAVEKGFKNAEKMWGGELPEISQQTYNSVMSEFDKWKSEANA